MGSMPRPVASTFVAALFVAFVACKRSDHPRVASFIAPPLPAGFVEQSGGGWRIAVPSTWKDAGHASRDLQALDGGTAPAQPADGATQSSRASRALADPQVVDDFRANVNVVTEVFPRASYDYARANEATLRREGRGALEVARDDVVDGDPTLVLETRWPSSPATVAYRTMQTALASRGTGYVVTCAASSSAFERYRSTCESILHSFAVER
jgi:hypothetical protein